MTPTRGEADVSLIIKRVKFGGKWRNDPLGFSPSRNVIADQDQDAILSAVA
jgi:hypothetical protein